MRNISRNKRASVFYHNIFDYPLTCEELVKWKVGDSALHIFPKDIKIDTKNGFYFIDTRGDIVYLRKKRIFYSQRKMGLAKKIAITLSFLPTVKMVALTGSLAMMNADRNSDIDLMFVTKSGFLWTSRCLVYLLLLFLKIPFRKFGRSGKKDMLCLNIWLDESCLTWPVKNIFTAHELAQVVPLVNKDRAYESLLLGNLWILDFWPNAIDRKISASKRAKLEKIFDLAFCFWFPLELFLFFVQRLYMLGKPNKGFVGLRRAVFHPLDLSKIVLRRLKTS